MASYQLERGFTDQGKIFQRYVTRFGVDYDVFVYDGQQAIDEARHNIIKSLFMLNLLILIIAGGLSYYLARRTLQPIEESHDAQSRFTADASHELRTPITAMRTETEVTLLDPKLSLKDAKSQLRSNLEELDKLASLSENLLGLARLTSTTIRKEKILANDVVQSAVERVKHKAEIKNILIDAQVPEQLQILADTPSITEALVTLLDNAVKYSSEKTVITIIARNDRLSSIISVRDAGEGISDVDQQHVFDRFYRADAARTQSDKNGYGLGLSIAKRIVDLHQGSIIVQSKIGHGSAFSIKLPRSSSPIK